MCVTCHKPDSASMAPMRARAFCFTLNNYTEFEEAAISEIKTRYTIFGRETGEQGTKHLQGYLYFENARSHEAVRALVPRAHIEVARGDATANYKYCTKDGDYYEHGDKPNNMQPTTYDECKTFAQIQYLRFMSLHALPARDPEKPPKVLWYHGPAGSGKTRKAYESSKDVYIKDGTGWWDGYRGQDTIIIDDFDPPVKETDFRLFLRLLDRYPYQGQLKGAYVEISSSTIIITCEFPPEYFWPLGNRLAQVSRRITEVVEFKALTNTQAKQSDQG